MNSVKMSNGLYLDKSKADYRIRKAKEKKLAIHLEEFGYYFCTTCEENDCKPIDCAHIIGVDECNKTGRAELAWDLDNIVIEGRYCHQKRDGLGLAFGSV